MTKTDEIAELVEDLVEEVLRRVVEDEVPPQAQIQLGLGVNRCSGDVVATVRQHLLFGPPAALVGEDDVG
jgi:class 3 adenylate cyclase